MEFGVVLPTMPAGASPEGIDAAAETAERLGWRTAWATDKVLPPRALAGTYSEIFEALVTLTFVAARHPTIRVGASVIIVAQRQAVVLARELATLDALNGGRTIAGVGAGWDEREFANVGVADRFRVRGAYLDETIRLWRHLWSGEGTPFEGRFFRFSDYLFGPLPVQGAGLPIVVGGESAAALRRAGALGDGYDGGSSSPADFVARAPVIRAAAVAAGRPMPTLVGRVSVDLSRRKADGPGLSGTPREMAEGVTAYRAAGLGELAFAFGETDPGRVAAAMERFDREVLSIVRADPGRREDPDGTVGGGRPSGRVRG